MICFQHFFNLKFTVQSSLGTYFDLKMKNKVELMK